MFHDQELESYLLIEHIELSLTEISLLMTNQTTSDKKNALKTSFLVLDINVFISMSCYVSLQNMYMQISLSFSSHQLLKTLIDFSSQIIIIMSVKKKLQKSYITFILSNENKDELVYDFYNDYNFSCTKISVIVE